MKLLLNSSTEINFTCKEDLEKAVPIGTQGKALNFGQGEGQIEIEDAVWGFYVNVNGGYYMAFEEGNLEWEKLNNTVQAIVAALSENFGGAITVLAEGPFTGNSNV